MDPELRAMFNKVTKGALSGKAGEKATEDFKINGQYVDQPGKPVTLHGVTTHGVVGIPFFDGYVEKAALEFLDTAAQEPEQAVLHQRQFHEGAPAEPAGARSSSHKSLSKSKYADSVVELDTRIGRIMDKLRALGLDKNTLVSTRPTTAPGRMSIRTLAIRRSVAPRVRCAKAATAFPRLPYGPARSRPARRITTSSAAST